MLTVDVVGLPVLVCRTEGGNGEVSSEMVMADEWGRELLVEKRKD